MAAEKKYILDMNCSGSEEFDGSCWINEEELSKLQKKAGCAQPNSCNCKLTLKDAEGRFLFSRPVC